MLILIIQYFHINGGEVYTGINFCGDYWVVNGEEEDIRQFINSVIMDFNYVGKEGCYTEEQYNNLDKTVYYEFEFNTMIRIN